MFYAIRFIRKSFGIAVVNESLSSHGSGPYYAILFACRIGSWKRDMRLSIGGYGWGWSYYPRRIHYHLTATHYGIGPVCLSYIVNPFVSLVP